MKKMHKNLKLINKNIIIIKTIENNKMIVIMTIMNSVKNL